MSVNNYYNNPEKDTLQVNMELVSKELNELIINEENDYGIMQAQVHTSYTAYHPAPPTNVHAVDNIPGKTNLYEKHSSHYMCYERRQEREQIPTSQTFYTNPSNNSYVVASSKLLHPPNLTKQLSSRPAVYPYTYTDIACVNTETPRTLQMLPNNGTTYTYTASNEYQSLPKYKFHYLRSHNETGKMTSPPLISMTTREDTQAATFRKHPKSYVKHNIRSPTSSFPDYNYNNIVVDLSVLGISEDG